MTRECAFLNSPSMGRPYTARARQVYQVQRVCDSRTSAGVTLYRVRWRGYRASCDTWEPIEHFEDRSVVDEYYLRTLPREVVTVASGDVNNANEDNKCDIDAAGETSSSSNCPETAVSPEQSQHMSPTDVGAEAPMAAYEMARLQRILQNEAKLAELGFGMAPLVLPSTPLGAKRIVCEHNKSNAKKRGLSERRRSFRLATEQTMTPIRRAGAGAETSSSRLRLGSLARQAMLALRSKSIAKVSRAQTEDLICRSCHKSFLSPLGLQYHQANRVCLRQAQFVRDSASAPGGADSLSCNVCWKHFLSELGLKYHVKHKVCERVVSIANASWFPQTCSAA